MASTSGGTSSRRQALTRFAVAVATMVAASGLAVDSVSANTASGSAAGVPLTDGSMYNVVDQIGARALWQQGITGRGVNVAVIDTGVVPTPALSGADKVVAMVDLSGEGSDDSLVYGDTYGHGTHMAGIIAGRDPGANPATAASRPDWFLGVAPDAGIVSVKVAGSSGAVDVTQVIAGIDWTIENAAELGIRVINLSYASGSTLDYIGDPLSFAVERAWRAGIVVVVAAGNDGRNEFELGMPAQNPYVIAVAAAERKSNGGWATPMWATSGDGVRNPDVSAPGRSIVSLRAAGSTIDTQHPTGYVSEHLFKGSGSSQAAAVVSGAAALLISGRPQLTPDQVKALLASTADRNAIVPRDERRSGQGLIAVSRANSAAPTAAVQTWSASVGNGSLDAARGGQHIALDGVVLQGEVAFNGSRWVGSRWVGSRWVDAVWNGSRWVDGTWMGSRWVGSRWVGSRWVGAAWEGSRWVGSRWVGSTWTSATWTGSRWVDVSWDGSRWVDTSWGGSRWVGAGW